MADALDLLSIDEARPVVSVGRGDVAKAELLAPLVTAVSRRIDQAIGPVIVRAVSAELHDGGSQTIWLRRYPVTSITSVTEYAGVTPTVLAREAPGTAGDYLAEPYEHADGLLSGELYRRASGHTKCWASGTRNIAVTYVAGRCASTAAVDPKIKQAAAIMLRNLWRSYEQSIGQVGEFAVPTQSFPGTAIPKAAMTLLREEWQELAGWA